MEKSEKVEKVKKGVISRSASREPVRAASVSCVLHTLFSWTGSERAVLHISPDATCAQVAPSRRECQHRPLYPVTMIDHLPSFECVVVPRTPSHTADDLIHAHVRCSVTRAVACCSRPTQESLCCRATRGTVLFLEQNNHRAPESLAIRDF